MHEHSLSLLIGAILLTWLLLYWRADPTTHLGAFYGNAAADWLGSFVIAAGQRNEHPFGDGVRDRHQHAERVPRL